MSNIWFKLQGLKGPPSHGGEWFEVLSTDLSGRQRRLPIELIVPLDATSQQFYELAMKGTVFDKATVLLQPQTELYFYECDLRSPRAHHVTDDDVRLQFQVYYVRSGLKHSGG